MMPDQVNRMKVVAFAGGVGGAKLVAGLSKILPASSLTVVVNTGDDFDHFSLRICPDLDTVCYTLAGFANSMTGWGWEDETWNAMQSLEQLNAPTWFRLGDRDLGTHLERTRLLAAGWKLNEVTEKFCRQWGIGVHILPMSNDRTPTLVDTAEGQLDFQDYFVRLNCQPRVSGFHFAESESAQPAPGVLDALQEADIVIICPSNPWVSIGPILAVPGIKATMMAASEGRPVIAVSPIIAGAAVKGPAAKMYKEMGLEPSATSVAQHYGSRSQGGILTGYVFDHRDADQNDVITALGLLTLVTNTLMKSDEDRLFLAKEVLAFGQNLISEHERRLN
jgi:LPPG:FO 2-phospho-L-lactate transferase